jgi:uncharacterized protein
MNPIVHFEIPIKEPGRAKQFYEKVFGWNVEAWGEEGYWMAKTTESDKEGMPKMKGALNGALYKGNPGHDPSILVVQVPSIAKHVDTITKAGGTLIKERTPVGDMGFYAQIRDTEGNVIGLWEMAKKAG